MRLLFLCCLIGCPLIVQAQEAVVRGTVTLQGTETGLPGVQIYLENSTRGTLTTADGRFTLHIPAGERVIVARLLGYETARQRIQVAAGATHTLAFTLQEQILEGPEIVVERNTLTGGFRGVNGIAGSATYLGPQALEAFSYNDVSRVLQTVAGVNVQEEDGYGLRPNIGLRGTGVERSAKITLMEDGVLMAPAPYAAPAAYYFPTMGRMQGIEVRKGSSQIKYGPYTTGGALNLLSTTIPNAFTGRLDLLAGAHDQRTLHASVGHSAGRFGFVAETYQDRTDGFKNLDGGGPTGYDKQDYLLKLRLQSRPTARIYQALTVKLGRTDETSDETYLGLTAADFEASPNRRYAASQVDQMTAAHRQYVAQYIVQPAAFLDVTLTAYHTDFHRNWYKLDRVRATPGGDRVKIAALLDDPASHDAAYALLTGNTSPNDDALEVKANNRTYYAEGVQALAGLRLGQGALRHDLELGLRLHRDEMDRFQWVDKYRMDAGQMTLTTAGVPGTDSNRLEQAEATAAYAQYTLTYGPLTATPGLRYEHITLRRRDFGKSDPDRVGTDLSVRSNTVSVWIPGLGLDYAFGERASIFAGIHQGFAPPGSKDGVDPERSVNYELGGRLALAGLHVQTVGFFNDYTNLLGSDLAAAGGQGTPDAFNGGAVHSYGLELTAAYDFAGLLGTRVALPLHLAYTFTRATFQHAFESEFDPWGTVAEGDELPYVPRHQLGLQLGLQASRFGAALNARYVGAVRTEAGQGPIPSGTRIAPHLVLDLSADVSVTRYAQVFASIRNLTDEVYIAARRPAGLRPGLPRTLVLGVKTRF